MVVIFIASPPDDTEVDDPGVLAPAPVDEQPTSHHLAAGPDPVSGWRRTRWNRLVPGMQGRLQSLWITLPLDSGSAEGLETVRSAAYAKTPSWTLLFEICRRGRDCQGFVRLVHRPGDNSPGLWITQLVPTGSAGRDFGTQCEADLAVATKRLTASASLIPGADSTPLATSTA